MSATQAVLICHLISTHLPPWEQLVWPWVSGRQESNCASLERIHRHTLIHSPWLTRLLPI